MGIDATEALSPSPIIGAGRPGSVIAGKSGLAGACVRGTILKRRNGAQCPKNQAYPIVYGADMEGA